MKKRLLVFILLVSIVFLSAEELSIRKGAFLSAMAPGLGQLYSKNYTKSGIFLTTEIAIIFSYLRFKAEKEWAIDSYQEFAYNVAEISRNSSDDHYQLVQDYMSSEEYNIGVESYARNVFLSVNSPYYDPTDYYSYLETHLIPADLSWDWEDNRNWNRYKSIRRDKQDFEIYANFALAAAILNRLISVIDSAISINKYNKNNGLSNLKIDPDWKNKGVKISYEYKF